MDWPFPDRDNPNRLKLRLKARLFIGPLKSRRLRHQLVLIVFVATLILPVLVLLNDSAEAAPPYTASSVLGQLDGKGQPRFTSNTLYNNTGLAPDGGINHAGLDTPSGIAVDETGHLLFVSDEFSNRVLVYQLDSNNKLNSYTASFVLGQADLNTYETGPILTQNRMDTPMGLAYDSARDWLFVVDDGNCRVLVFNLSSGITNGMNASFVLGQPDFTTCNVGTTQNGMTGPTGVAFDPSTDNLFVADYSNRRVVVYDTTSISNGMNASFVLGQPDFTTNTAGTTQSKTSNVSGVYYDTGSDYLFVADDSNNRTLVFDLSGGMSDGMNASFVLGQSNFTSNTAAVTQAGSQGPIDIAYDAVREYLFVTEFDGLRTMVYDISSGISNGMNALYVIGQPNFTAQDSDRDQNGQDSPMTVEYLPSSDTLLVGDYRRLLEYDASVLATSMNAQALLGQNNGANQPEYTSYFYDNYGWFTSAVAGSEAVLLDPIDHRLFVADQENQRIMVYNLDSSNNLTSVHADFVIGRPNFNQMNLNAAPSQSNLMWDSGGQPISMSYDSAGNRLFVADPDFYRVMVWDFSSGISNGMNASFVLGQPNFTTSTQATTQNGMSMPSGVFYDNSGQRLFVSDSPNNRVLIYDTSSGLSNGMNASSVLGQTNFTASTGAAFSGSEPHKFSQPRGLGFDSANNRLFVSEYNHVKIFDLSAGITNGMNASNILGDTNFTYGGTFTLPYKQRFGGATKSVWYDPASQALFVADSAFHRVLTFNLSGGITNGQAAVDVIGQSNYNDNGSGLSQTKFNDPTAMAYDAANQRLFVSDNSNNRVMIYNSYQVPDNPGDPYAASNLLGQINGSGGALYNQGAAYNGAGFGNPNQEGFEYPQGVVMDKTNHRLFVSECGYGVRVFNLDSSNALIDRYPDFVIGQANFTSSSTTVNQSTLNCAIGASYDETNQRLFVPDSNNNRVMVFDLSSGITNGMNASFVLGQPDFTSNTSAVTQNGMGYSYGGSAYDPATQHLYVSDSEYARVLVYNLSGGITNGMNAQYVIGQPNFTSSAQNITQSGLSFPNGMVLDEAGDRLFVADWGSAGRVLAYNTNALATGMNASNVLGEADFTSSNSASDTGPTADAKSFGPGGLAYDSVKQRLFIEDNNVNRVMIFDVSTIVNNEDAVAWVGQWSLLDDVYDCTPSQTYMCGPYGMSDYYDTTNNRLYVSDNGFHRVLIYHFADLKENLPAGTSGSAYSQTVGNYSQGTPTYSVTAGSLPSGMTLNSSSGLISGTPSSAGTYNFTVGLSDNNGALGTFTDSKAYVLSVNTGSPDTTPPSVPTGLTKTGSTTSTISISWNASTDNVAVTGYHIFRNGVQVGDVTGTTFTDTGLNAGTSYTYTVTAYDGASNESAQSSALNASTNTSGGGSPGGGSSSGGGGSSSGGGSGGSGSPGSPTVAPPATIDLDEQPAYNSPTGYTDNGVKGSSYSHDLPGGGQNTITVSSISGGNVVLTNSDGSQKTVSSGNQLAQDSDGDGKADILISIGSVGGGTVEITFKKLSPPAAAAVPKPASGLAPTDSPGWFEALLKRLNNFLRSLFADVPPQLIWAFPWLIFVLLALTISRLLWQAREQAKKIQNLRQLTAKEKQLAEEKHNFITLSSHYLRTPLTVISGGIELLSALGGSPSAGLKAKADRLGAKINDLLAGFNQYPLSPAAGFSQSASGRLWTQPGFYLPVGLAFALAGFANYLYSVVLSYRPSTVNLMTQIVAGLLLAILLLAAKRRWAFQSAVSRQEESLLAGERALDADRNELIKSSVAELETDLAHLKKELLNGAEGENAKRLRPALSGVSEFEATIAKFKTVAGLESIGIAHRTAMMDLYAVLDNLLTRHAVDIKAKNLTIQPKFEVDKLNQDELLLSTVLETLIDNAVKYSPEGGVITVASRRGLSGKTEITVHNDGQSIPLAKMDQLFKPFSRAEDAAADFSHAGMGLSLYMDKLIMDYMGGKTEAVPEADGQGASFKLELTAA